MDRGTRDRGVSEVVGFILVFGMLVTAFTVYQGIVVPDQNRQAEFQHNQDVQGQLQDLRNAIVSTASTGNGQAVSVTPGATYPTRVVAQNLGVSTGAIQTVESSSDVRIENVRALDDETRDYVNGPLGPFETKSIRYTPVYSFYTNAPTTVYENTLAYNQFDGANLTLTDQVVIDGRRITLVALDGSLSTTRRDTVSISTRAISVSENRVAVRNTTGGRVTLTIPTALPASKWEELLEEERVSNGGFVETVVPVPDENAVAITLRGNVVYEVRLAKVGVGGATIDEPASYVTPVQGTDASVPEGGTQKLVVEVRDRFNNPASNVTVSSGTPLQGSVSPSTETTDGDGRSTFVYSAPSDVNGTQDVDVDVSFDGDGTANETVTFHLRVLDSDGSGGGGDETGTDDINPAGREDVRLEGVTASNEVATLTLNNSAGEVVNVTAARVNFYLESNDQEAAVAELSRGSPVSANLSVGGAFSDLEPQIVLGAGATTDVTVAFYRDEAKSQTRDIDSGEFFVLSITYSNGETDTYFVQP